MSIDDGRTSATAPDPEHEEQGTAHEEQSQPEVETPGSVAEHLSKTLSHDEGEGSQRLT